jgi:hypothetical protein
MAAARLLVFRGLAGTDRPGGGLVRREESSASLKKLLEYKDVIMYDKGDKMIQWTH